MGTKLSPSDNELYKRADEVLHYLWDPIGVAEVPEARDEYHSYLGPVFSRLKTTKDGKDISDYLISVEKEMMGLTVTEESIKRDREIVETLLIYRDLIKEKSEQGS